jgi:hypothetical protein
MIQVQTKFEARQEQLLKAVERAKAGSLSSAAFLVRAKAIDSVKHSKTIRGYFWRKNRDGVPVLRTYYEPSPPGQPILAHRKGVGFFRAGIKYAVDKPKGDAVIGFLHSRFQEMAATHEHGLSWNGVQYDKRPTMAPALAATVDKFHSDWEASIS